MENQNLKKKNKSERKNKEEKGQEDLSQNKDDHAQFYSPQNKSPEKMRIKVDENFQLELQKEKEKKPKIKIFNNKKNNGICSELLKSTLINEKELILLPYAKEKQKVFKTLNTIGNAHGISYPTCSVIKGSSLKDKIYLNIIRDDKKKKRRKRKDLTIYKKNNKEEIKKYNFIINVKIKENQNSERNWHSFYNFC